MFVLPALDPKRLKSWSWSDLCLIQRALMHSNLLLLCLTDTTAAYFTCCSGLRRPTPKGSSLRVYTLKAGRSDRNVCGQFRFFASAGFWKHSLSFWKPLPSIQRGASQVKWKPACRSHPCACSLCPPRVWTTEGICEHWTTANERRQAAVGTLPFVGDILL